MKILFSVHDIKLNGFFVLRWPTKVVKYFESAAIGYVRRYIFYTGEKSRF